MQSMSINSHHLRQRLAHIAKRTRELGLVSAAGQAIQKNIFARAYRRYLLGSFSLFREDLFLDWVMDGRKSGFYVDIGANHPVRGNNTCRFYRSGGWQGINIEPTAECFRLLCKMRPRDINLNIGIGTQDGVFTLNVFDDDRLSTFSAKHEAQVSGRGYLSVERRSVVVRRLSDVLAEHASDRPIDFMSVDTEGRVLDVLMSNDWERFRPGLICVESISFGAGGAELPEMRQFLEKVGYSWLYFNGTNSFYIDSRRLNADVTASNALAVAYLDDCCHR